MTPSLGTKLKLIRKDNGLTQKQVAKAAGISVGTLSRIERGHQDVRISNIITVAVTLGQRLTIRMLPDGR